MKNVLRLTVYAEFCSVLLIACFSSVSISNVYAQNVQEMYRITDSKTFFAPPEPYVKSTFEAPPIPPGGERVLADIEGPGKITYLYATDSTKGRWNPGLVLRIYWDGAKEPSVNVPVSDFFGGFQSQTVDFSSYPMQVRENNFMCFLPMPFQKRARFVLYNESSEEYKDAFIYLIQYEKGDEYAEEKSRLHCRWNRENPVRDGMYEALDVRGKGSYVGHFLQVTAGHTSWWGEGDLIYTIDGERMRGGLSPDLFPVICSIQTEREDGQKRNSSLLPIGFTAGIVLIRSDSRSRLRLRFRTKTGSNALTISRLFHFGIRKGRKG